jgi:hypothetical protein
MPAISPAIYIGVDPGASGGLASICDGEALAIHMPLTETDVWEWVKENEIPDGWESIGGVFAIIEQVSGYIGEGHPGSAMFKFGMSYGGLRMALTAAQIPFEAVTPQAWQKGLGITKRGKQETRTSFKNRLKAKAQQLFPEVKVTLATADALLIAEYCKRKRTGTL